MSASSSLNTVVATYRVRAGQEPAFLALLGKHFPTLRRLGLVTADPPVVYRGAEDDGRPIVFEIFTWRDAAAVETAHQSPAVMEIWEAMGALVEERDGKPMFEFPHVERISIAFAP